jgi:DNA-binding transcriptional MerR regulator
MDAGDRRGLDAGLDRVTIQEAARRLGVSEGAIRKRVTRNTLHHEKAPDGRVYVYLDAGDRQRVDAVQDTGVNPHSTALISQLEGEVEFLRDQVRRQQEIIAQQALTMRQLSAPQGTEESSEAAEMVEEEPEEAEPRPEPRPAAADPQTGSQRPQREPSTLRSLRRRIFGR